MIFLFLKLNIYGILINRIKSYFMVFTWDSSFSFLSKSPWEFILSIIYVSFFVSFSFVSKNIPTNFDSFFFYWFFSNRDIWIHEFMCLYWSCSWINENVQKFYLPLPFYESLPFLHMASLLPLATSTNSKLNLKAIFRPRSILDAPNNQRMASVFLSVDSISMGTWWVDLPTRLAFFNLQSNNL